SRDVVKEVYGLTYSFPKSEIYGLISQIQRSVISIPSNIAEGAGKTSSKDFIRFLEIAYSSSCELETQLILSMDLGFVSSEKFEDVCCKINEIQKMVFGLIQKLKND
ncbi:MAG: four helix bundle protein, partial [Candidatus Marinimicrobia bacterium]|nr:four helix bundle protein [Candidatus Neomarinimicrobiota bacterium]